MNENLNLLLTMLSSGFFGIIVALVYKMAHSRAVFSARMQRALIIYAMIPAMMLFLNFHIGGIAIIGAITLMRFREPVKDHRDLVYIFWAVASGFACAAHQFLLLGIGSIMVVLVLVGIGAVQKNNRVLLVVRGTASAENDIIEEIMNRDENFLKMRYNNSVEGSYTELIYEIKNRCENKIEWGEKLKRVLYGIEEVTEVNLFYQQDDMGI